MILCDDDDGDDDDDDNNNNNDDDDDDDDGMTMWCWRANDSDIGNMTWWYGYCWL